jgi:hypothetical protein
MKLTYIDCEGTDISDQIEDLSEHAAALRQLPPRAAGFALIGLICRHDDLMLDFVRVEGDDKKLTVTFGDDRASDTIEVEF